MENIYPRINLEQHPKAQLEPKRLTQVHTSGYTRPFRAFQKAASVLDFATWHGEVVAPPLGIKSSLLFEAPGRKSIGKPLVFIDF